MDPDTGKWKIRFVISANPYNFRQTIDVSLMKLYYYLRWCMEFNMAKCQRYVYKTEAAIFPCRLCSLGAFPVISLMFLLNF